METLYLQRSSNFNIGRIHGENAWDYTTLELEKPTYEELCISSSQGHDTQGQDTQGQYTQFQGHDKNISLHPFPCISSIVCVPVSFSISFKHLSSCYIPTNHD